MTDDVGPAAVAQTHAQADARPHQQPHQQTLQLRADSANPRPKLSVIIACLNGAATLGTQLEALAGQPCPVPWELLLADNGSTDASVAIAESFRPRIPTLRIIDASSHRGAGPARN